MRIRADLHNHSCLSPCGSLEMSPRFIAEHAKARGIGLMALTDHNSALNAPAWDINARQYGIIPLFGIEVTSIEEVHILCIFGTPDEALIFSNEISKVQPKIKYNVDMFGEEVVVDEHENVLDILDYYLGMATDWSFDDVIRNGKAAGAIVIPSHIDRPAYGAISQLGFLPEGNYDAVEVIREESYHGKLAVIKNSDAHHPEQIGRRNFVIDTECNLINNQGYVNIENLREVLYEKKIIIS
ncbi:MAG TPA: PHP domain-containing protein [Spirochaetia bacterium]|nr:PHP domain-containing protein [Spirochaetales bacterium]HPD80687.1 PHP domain-containing protein [Spirochaetales bacterium]HQK33228.1 PHP domain-containing protein [Spirochaetales bacterium]HRS65771.1 PHP domain-containing protein [Spirochaetia bacterium]HRV29039.1 PHP domain-containing protein [Spirochaetia bacterium]